VAGRPRFLAVVAGIRYRVVRRTGSSDYSVCDETMDDHALIADLKERLATAEAALRRKSDIEAGLREGEERQAFLLRLSDALRPVADPVEIQMTAARLLGQHLGANRVAYAEDAGDGETIILARSYNAGVPGMEGRYRYADYGPDPLRALRAGQPVVRSDIASDQRLSEAEKAAHARLQLGAILDVPLVKAGRLVAVLAVHFAAAHVFRPGEVRLALEVAERTWAAVERARAQTAAHALAERSREILESISDAFYAVDRDWRFTYVNRRAEDWWSRSRTDLLGKVYWEEFPQAVGSEAYRAHLRAAETGNVVRLETVSPILGHWIDMSVYPTVEGGLSVYFRDISAKRRAEEALRQSEERLRRAAQVGGLGLWDWNMRTGEIHWSDEHFRMEGYAVGEVTPSYEIWAARLHPDDRAETERAVHDAQESGGDYAHEFRTLHPDGTVRWLSAQGQFFYDAAGAPVRMVGVMIDTTARRTWEETQKVLVAELQHRTRNLLGVVRSLSERTIRRSTDLTDFRARFGDRLAALARVQGLLSRLGEGQRITFDELIRSEVAALHGENGRVTLTGPGGIALRSSTVQTFALALHELATNAVKYGAFSQRQGRLAVRWWVERAAEDGRPWLHVDWREHDVAMPRESGTPEGTGSGRELIERALPYQLGARTTYVMEADGVHCTIALPVSERQPVSGAIDA
jgi:PAS domain S-box-containing protein